MENTENTEHRDIKSLHDQVKTLASRSLAFPIEVSVFKDAGLMIVQCDKKALNKEVIDSIVKVAAEESYKILYYNRTIIPSRTSLRISRSSKIEQ